MKSNYKIVKHYLYVPTQRRNNTWEKQLSVIEWYYKKYEALKNSFLTYFWEILTRFVIYHSKKKKTFPI